MGKPNSSPDRTRSWANRLAWNRHDSAHRQAPILPTSNPPTAGDDGITTTSSGSTAPLRNDTHSSTGDTAFKTHVPDNTSATRPATTSPPDDTKAAGEESAPIEGAGDAEKPKLSLSKRAKAGTRRFGAHTKDALFHSWINVLLIFVPIGIAVKAAGLNATIVFAMNAVAIVPLAGMLAFATESVASRLGDTLGALLNVSFGNAVELIIFIALVKNEIRVVQAALLGSILANLLLILGMAFVLGGLRYREQIYNSTVTQMSACLLSLSVMSLLLPTAFHASFSNSSSADKYTLKISRGTSVVLLLVYILFLVFQLKSHAYLYSSMPQEQIDEESHPGVLHDFLDPATSSDSSSSSSSSDSDGSNGSHTTAKKIKRFIRKRRKSSASSTEAPSLPSFVSSPTSEPTGFDEAIKTSRRGSVTLPDILSGDEGDTDGTRHKQKDFNAPKHRDMQDAYNGIPSTSPGPASPEVKPKKKSKKHRKHKHNGKNPLPEPAMDLSEKPPVETPANVTTDAPSPRAVGFAEDVNFKEGAAPAAKKSPLKPFPRPALPKLLSQNVFVDPQPSGSPSLRPVRMASRTGAAPVLRRTSSLPDRLNETSNTQDARPLPPFVARSVFPGKARTETDASEPQAEKEADENMSRTAAVMMLLISTGLVALCAEFLVDAIPEMTKQSTVSQAFIGLIILPIVGNAAEHVTAVTVAAKNKMDLAIGVAVGSSIQIALFVTPLVVILGWCMNKGMSLYFNLFETVSLFATAFVVNFLVLDGRSNYLEGTLLIAAYVIIALAAFFYPDEVDQSALGGSEKAHVSMTAVKMLMG
ncbi:hypothetical protein EJ08DRAFT_591293 [Tothia fuscella]|uniref:Sodium/calcium exchanger membrane region domain-containing protein n=1 Tax=Tothia fuscella TaxID=1048955 RepID=A0A9P4TXS7_9PEZI|nr:hypothetical protein EJ08DRAFT_591293 [Tothia fuscella]